MTPATELADQLGISVAAVRAIQREVLEWVRDRQPNRIVVVNEIDRIEQAGRADDARDRERLFWGGLGRCI